MDVTVVVEGHELAYRDEGEGPAVLLLHGVPDSGALWRHQVAPLHDAGYRTIVPDLLGFGRSARPTDVAPYRLQSALGGVTGILRHAEVDRAHVVGHDWGGQLAWLLAAVAPRRVDHLVVLASPHPAVLWDPPVEQRERGWYVLLAQFPEAEALLQRDDFALFRRLLREPADMASYVADLARPGALTACLNWYRANYGPAYDLAGPPRMPPITAPTLTVSTPGDHFFLEDLVRASADHVLGPTEHVSVAVSSHWLPLDVPDEISGLLLRFLGAHPTTAPAPRRRVGVRR